MAINFSAQDIGKLNTDVTAGTPITGTYTPGGGSNRGLIVTLHFGDDGGVATFSAATYDGKNMTFIDQSNGPASPTANVASWYVKETDVGSGSKTISITRSDDRVRSYVLSVAESVDVDQATFLGSTSPVKGTGTGDTSSHTLTTDEATSEIILVANHRRNASPYTGLGGTVILTQDNTGGSTDSTTSSVAKEGATGGSDTIAVQAASAERNASIAFEVLEASVTPTGAQFTRRYYDRMMVA